MHDLEMTAERIPHWHPGIPGGIPEVPVRADVTKFGARGDGRADDTAAVQKAIDEVDASGAVFLPEGTYLLTTTLRLRSGVVLRGAGRDRTHLRIECAKPESVGIDLAGRQSGEAVPLGADVEAGTIALVVVQPHELKADQYVALVCDNDPQRLYTRPEWNTDWGRDAVGQVLRIEAARGEMVTFDRPIRLGRGYFRTTHKSIIHNVLAFVNHEKGEAKPGVINRVGGYPWVLVAFLLELRVGLCGFSTGSSSIFVQFGCRREIASMC